MVGTTIDYTPVHGEAGIYAELMEIAKRLSGPAFLHSQLILQIGLLNGNRNLVLERLQLVENMLAEEDRALWGLFMRAANKESDKQMILSELDSMDEERLASWNMSFVQQVKSIIDSLLSDLQPDE
jgi:hypothetical protein